MRFAIIKPDLDTCLTAYLLGCSGKDHVLFLNDTASCELLNAPDIFCIEAGGSGDLKSGNFDHHDPARYHPPACRQAYGFNGIYEPLLNRLVEYVCMIDDGPLHTIVPVPSLATVFSGMCLCTAEIPLRFRHGLDMIATIHRNRLEPFNPLPKYPQWRKWIDAKTENRRNLSQILQKVQIYVTSGGFRLAYLPMPEDGIRVYGGVGALYSLGCEYAMIYDPLFGSPPSRKFTIASNCAKVCGVIQELTRLEPGWGGREKIIGSPRTGSNLSEQTVLETVLQYL